MDALKVFEKTNSTDFCRESNFEDLVSYAKKHGWTDESIVEIFTDLSQFVRLNDRYGLIYAEDYEIHSSIFGGIPKHSNFFYLIVIKCGKSIPKWFFEKYVDNEEERKNWGHHVPKKHKIEK
jgi:hypothetical protein